MLVPRLVVLPQQHAHDLDSAPQLPCPLQPEPSPRVGSAI